MGCEREEESTSLPCETTTKRCDVEPEIRPKPFLLERTKLKNFGEIRTKLIITPNRLKIPDPIRQKFEIPNTVELVPLIMNKVRFF